MRKIHQQIQGKENKTGCDLQDVQSLQAGHGTVIASTEFGVTFKEMGGDRNQRNKYGHIHTCNPVVRNNASRM